MKLFCCFHKFMSLILLPDWQLYVEHDEMVYWEVVAVLQERFFLNGLLWKCYFDIHWWYFYERQISIHLVNEYQTLTESWWRHQMETFATLLALCEGNPPVTRHRWIPLTPASDTALMFSLIYAWTNGWANNWDTGDLQHHGAHYDVTVMMNQ